MQKAKTVLEIGMYTGYSALAFAEVLPDDGKVFTCDIDPYLKQFAERSFARSAHGHKIKICLGEHVYKMYAAIKRCLYKNLGTNGPEKGHLKLGC